MISDFLPLPLCSRCAVDFLSSLSFLDTYIEAGLLTMFMGLLLVCEITLIIIFGL